jgi:hypothetical protein
LVREWDDQLDRTAPGQQAKLLELLPLTGRDGCTGK